MVLAPQRYASQQSWSEWLKIIVVIITFHFPFSIFNFQFSIFNSK